MGRIPEDTIQAVRDRVDIVDLVGRHVSLKKAGRSYKGLCPFHDEKTPSFTVSPDRGTYHCFGCGEGGNALAFLMRHENLTFPEAVRSLAAEVGIEIQETGGGERGLAEQLLRANAVAQGLYRRSLSQPDAQRGREYLVRRGIHDALIDRFGIGFAPDRWDGVVSALGKERIDARVGERAGLLKERERGGHYDLLRGRITFPIQDARGRVVGFGGRALGDDQEPKYLNSPETPVFRKREAFYGFPFALEPIRRNDRAVVVEGYFDLIALHRAGVEEALATCGTALSEEHGKQLRRRVRNVVLLFDGDDAGQKAALRALELLLPHGLRVRAAALPPGMDPDDFLSQHGEDALRQLIDDAPPALEIAIRRAAAAAGNSPWERADAVERVVPLLVAVPDPVERGEFARQLAMAVGTAHEDVEAAVRAAARGESRSGGDSVTVRPRKATLEERRYSDMLRILLDHPELIAGLSRDEITAEAPDDAWRTLAEAILSAGERKTDVSALVDQLEGESRVLLSALASESRVPTDDSERAGRALRDTLEWLRRQSRRNAARRVTQSMAGSDADGMRLLSEKQRQIEERRKSAGLSPG